MYAPFINSDQLFIYMQVRQEEKFHIQNQV